MDPLAVETANIAVENHNYTPLADPSTHFRLLELSYLGANDDCKISCTLSSWPINNAPPYVAISYTWRPAEPTETIVLDGQRKVVRKNCADVLRQALFFEVGEHYFIDALCINQFSNEEKSGQVAMMGAIYSDAELVLASLGRLDKRIEAFGRMLERKDVRLGYVEDPSVESWWCHDYVKNLPPEEGAQLSRSLQAVAGRPYFERAWIVQEILLAKKVLFCCDFMRIWLESLSVMLSRDSKSALSPRGPSLQTQSAGSVIQDHTDVSSTIEKDTSAAGGLNATSLSALQLLKSHIDGHGRSRRPRLDLVAALLLTIGRACEDPRDKIYSILDLVINAGRREIPVDYSVQPFEVVARCLVHLGNHFSLVGELAHAMLPQKDKSILPAARGARTNKTDVEIRPSMKYLYKHVYCINGGDIRVDTRTCPGYKVISTWDVPPKVCGLAGYAMRTGDWIAFRSNHRNMTQPRLGNAFVLRPVATEHRPGTRTGTGFAFAVVGHALIDLEKRLERLPSARMEIGDKDQHLWRVDQYLWEEASNSLVCTMDWHKSDAERESCESVRFLHDKNWLPELRLSEDRCLSDRLKAGICHLPLSSWAYFHPSGDKNLDGQWTWNLDPLRSYLDSWGLWTTREEDRSQKRCELRWPQRSPRPADALSLATETQRTI